MIYLHIMYNAFHCVTQTQYVLINMYPTLFIFLYNISGSTYIDYIQLIFQKSKRLLIKRKHR